MTLWPHKSAAVWWDAAKAVLTQLNDRNLPLIAAGVAFFSLLALFPTITVLVAIWSVFADPASLRDQLAALREIAPAAAYEVIETQLTQLVAAPPVALSWTGGLALLVALWSARAGVGALTRGLNTVYDEDNRRGLKHVSRMLVLTVVLIATTTAFIGLLVVLPFALSLLPLGPATEIAIRLAKWAAIVAMLIVTLGLVYRLAPNRRAARVAWISPGAVFATTLWLPASAAFSVFLESFAQVNEVYGSLGAAIAVLLWFFLTALSVLLGGALNAELERRTEIDSTVGPRRPIGQRGATAADTYLTMN